MFMHKNWRKTDLLDKMKMQAGKRSLDNLTCGPVISWSTEKIQAHVDACMELDGAQLLFGGKPLKNHSIPAVYGAYEPTAIFVPLKHFRSAKKFKLLTTELFGPFQIITEFNDSQEDRVLEILEEQQAHLTAGIVSNDAAFTEKVLSHTVNGVTYHGIKARTTGAPQNHWFGPGGDSRGAGIGTPEAIQLTWSHHREIIRDTNPVDADWTMPNPQ
jgi:1-pyrroline-5-carboxylate dehydrogenase